MRFTRSSALLLVLALAAPLSARQDKVLIGGTPTPGQTQRTRMSQVMDLQLKAGDTAPAGFPAEGIRMEMTSDIVMTQKVGAPDADGRTRMDVTYESVSQGGSMNGRAMPMPSSSGGFEGQTLTLWMDKDNQVVDVTVPQGLPMSQGQAKQMFGQLFGAVPRQEMAVGETVSRPLSVAVPVPGGGASGQAVTGTTRITLSRIDGEGAGRVAVLTTVFDGALETPAASAADGRVTMSGEGTTQLALQSGLVLSAKSTTTIEGPMALPGAPVGMPPLTMHGVVTVTLERLP